VGVKKHTIYCGYGEVGGAERRSAENSIRCGIGSENPKG